MRMFKALGHVHRKGCQDLDGDDAWEPHHLCTNDPVTNLPRQACGALLCPVGDQLMPNQNEHAPLSSE